MENRKRSRLLWAGICAYILLVSSSIALAAETVEIKNNSNDTVFKLVFHGTADTNIEVAWDMNAEQKEALVRAAQYWADRVKPEGAPAEPVVIYVTTMEDNNASSAARTFAIGPNIYATAAELTLNNNRVLVENGWTDRHSTITIGSGTYNLDPNNSQISIGASLESTMIHEMGHTLGISSLAANYPDITSTWDGLLTNDIDGDVVIREGTLAHSIYNDGGSTRQYIPMDSASPQVRSHFGLINGLMTHRHFRNYSGFMEVEMAALNDLGYGIELRDFFGRSVYTSGNSIINGTGFFAYDGGNYQAGQSNTSSFGLGLHVFGGDNTIYQNADIMADGYAGGGIRSDGVGNTIIINPDITVQANGEYGTGVIVAYGHSGVLVNRGVIRAAGPEGDAVRFDIGRNQLGVYGRPDQASYFKTSLSATSEEYQLAEKLLDGALVKTFDLTGSLEASRNALYISPNAHVETVNIM